MKVAIGPLRRGMILMLGSAITRPVKKFVSIRQFLQREPLLGWSEIFRWTFDSVGTLSI